MHHLPLSLNQQNSLPYPGRLLGIDYGTKQIGVAVSDMVQTIALPKAVLALPDRAAFKKIMQEVSPVGIVLGVPFQLSGARQPLFKKASAYGVILGTRFNVPIFFMDERFTSAEAHKKAPWQQAIDDIAATIILQTYLDLKQRVRV